MLTNKPLVVLSPRSSKRLVLNLLASKVLGRSVNTKKRCNSLLNALTVMENSKYRKGMKLWPRTIF